MAGYGGVVVVGAMGIWGVDGRAGSCGLGLRGAIGSGERSSASWARADVGARAGACAGLGAAGGRGHARGSGVAVAVEVRRAVRGWRRRCGGWAVTWSIAAGRGPSRRRLGVRRAGGSAVPAGLPCRRLGVRRAGGSVVPGGSAASAAGGSSRRRVCRAGGFAVPVAGVRATIPSFSPLDRLPPPNGDWVGSGPSFSPFGRGGVPSVALLGVCAGRSRSAVRGLCRPRLLRARRRGRRPGRPGVWRVDPASRRPERE